MIDYISREEALNACCEGCSAARDCRPGERCVDYMRIKEIPAADVREVRRGKWICHTTLEYDGEWLCTVCGNEVTICMCGKDKTWTYNYCPNCGANMEEQT